jgi:hypothetical protein
MAVTSYENTSYLRHPVPDQPPLSPERDVEVPAEALLPPGIVKILVMDSYGPHRRPVGIVATPHSPATERRALAAGTR